MMSMMLFPSRGKVQRPSASRKGAMHEAKKRQDGKERNLPRRVAARLSHPEDARTEDDVVAAGAGPESPRDDSDLT
jgi:hypothetical protein